MKASGLRENKLQRLNNQSHSTISEPNPNMPLHSLYSDVTQNPLLSEEPIEPLPVAIPVKTLLNSQTVDLPFWFPRKPPSRPPLLKEGTLNDLNQPITIQTLHPSQISILISLGDSLLTGLGVTSTPHTLKNRLLSRLSTPKTLPLNWLLSGEHRQNSCVSGTEGVTLGRLLSYWGFVDGLCFGKTRMGSLGGGFNLARTGAFVKSLERQSARLVKLLKGREDEWKLVVIWIGSNDVFAKSLTKINAEFQTDLTNTLIHLQKNIGSAYVVILPLPPLPHLTIPAKLPLIKRKTKRVNEILHQIATEFEPTTTFKVRLVDLGGLEKMGGMFSMISGLDGVHPSFEAQGVFCKWIWDDIVGKDWFLPGDGDFLK